MLQVGRIPLSHGTSHLHGDDTISYLRLHPKNKKLRYLFSYDLMQGSKPKRKRVYKHSPKKKTLITSPVFLYL